MITRARLAWVLATALFLAAGDAHAHTRSMSYSTWRPEASGARVELRIKLLELTRRPPDHAWERTLPGELLLFSGDEPCTPGSVSRSPVAPEGWAVFRWRVKCAASGPRAVSSSLLRGVAASHTHFARVDPEEGAPEARPRERVLVTDRDGPWALDGAPAAEQPGSFAAYVSLGAVHIATGWDHLAFVIALLLLAAGLREVAGLVTGFTIGHSLTLGLAVGGWVRPESVAVEVLIGFSIALVAAENAWLLGGRDRWIPAGLAAALAAGLAAALFGSGALGAAAWLGLGLFSLCHFALLRESDRPARLRAAVAFAFGLIHGFGFAGILMELALPTEQLLLGLLGFNLGVELGQLAVVAVAWPLLHALATQRASAHRLLAELGSAAICGLGVFWLVSRNF